MDSITRKDLETITDGCHCRACGAPMADDGPLCELCQCEQDHSAPDVMPSTLEQSRKDLAAEGYQEGPPPWLKADMIACDARAAWGSACPLCGAVGLDYRPFWRSGGSYRALAVCGACGHTEEM